MNSANKQSGRHRSGEGINSAENSLRFGAEKVTTRLIKDPDSAEILHLVEVADWVHMHADWTLASDWWEAEGGIIASRRNHIIAMLVATLDPPPIAWLRAIAIDMSEPAYALRKLIEAVEPHLAKAGADHLACMSIAKWINEAMPANGFQVVSSLESMALEQIKPQTVNHTAFEIRSVLPIEGAKLANLDNAAFDNPLWRLSSRQLTRAITEAYICTAATQEDTLLGYQLSIRSSRKEAHLVRLTVNPEWHGKGVATSLLANTLDTFSKAGINAVTLNTQSDNSASQRLYRRFGFIPIGQRIPIWTKQLTQ